MAKKKAAAKEQEKRQKEKEKQKEQETDPVTFHFCLFFLLSFAGKTSFIQD